VPVFVNILQIGNGQAIGPIFRTTLEAFQSKSIGVAIGRKRAEDGKKRAEEIIESAGNARL
jgi:hypothetical protein